MDYPLCGAGCTTTAMTMAFLTWHSFLKSSHGSNGRSQGIGDAFLVELPVPCTR